MIKLQDIEMVLVAHKNCGLMHKETKVVKITIKIKEVVLAQNTSSVS